MITRLVKLTLLPEKTELFKEIFYEHEVSIKKFHGCLTQELQRDINSPTVFFTISKWNSVADLENYRKSELFKIIWPKIKILFAEKAMVWSLEVQ